ncbi:chorismate-binding protein [Arenibacter sp. F20364]|uniref:chorismate-binding protein n=1 Tax=Arenibacter sp. F20364 TaxID=2926415 RepID=UPI001FF5A859|nr:chorismate-binding protein [Arenibacter sp. F20364]MCK0192114.1 chorismate-binding protein [Arenibacter sp. F20364]
MSKGFLDQMIEQFQNGLPFVAYRKPDEVEVKVIFQKDKELHYISDYTESGFVFTPFDGESPAVLIKKDKVIVEAFELEPRNSESTLIHKLDEDADKDFYLKLIDRAISKIDSGSIQKVVLSRNIEVETSKTPFVMFQDLLNQYPTAFCYIWFHPKIGLWLGATPEIFLETENNKFRTMSLAGTQLYRAGEAPIWKKKELEEQEMVTQFIHSSLKNQVSSIEISETMSTRAGNLWHIKTSISGHMNNSGLQEIIAALHPTPAVCGLPKNTAKEFILKNENYQRQFYTGFLGELNFKEDMSRPSSRRNQENKAYRTIKNKTSLYVNLRCMQLLGNTVKIYVGGGITSRSVPEKEWQETKDKSSTMLNIVLK